MSQTFKNKEDSMGLDNVNFFVLFRLNKAKSQQNFKKQV